MLVGALNIPFFDRETNVMTMNCLQRSIASLYTSSRYKCLEWNPHVDSAVAKAPKRLYFLVQLKRAVGQAKELCSFYKTCIHPVIDYSCQLYNFALPEYLSDDLEHLQRRALRIVYP